MNYIRELNAFYDWLETNPLNHQCIALWHALMHTNSKAGWKKEFTVAVITLELKTGLNRRAIERARNTLEQVGLIRWRKRSGNQSAIYEMIPLSEKFVRQNGIQTVAQSDAQTVAQTVAQSDAQSVAINKTKRNETNIYLSSSSAHEENAKGDGVPSTEPNEAEISSFKQIEAKYIQRRARGFDLMPNDITVIEQLLQDGIPVDTILQGIDKAFDEYKPRFKNDRIKSMTYCEPIIRELHYLNERRKEARTNAEHGRSNQRGVGEFDFLSL